MSVLKVVMMEQIQVGYNAVQDRLMLSVSDKGTKYQVWLTRRFVILFLGQLQKAAANDPVVKQQPTAPQKSEIMDFQKQHAATQSNVSQSKTPIEVNTEEGPVLLATGIQVEGQTLHLLCLDKKRLSLGLTTSLTYALINLIEKALTHTGWGFKGVNPKPKESADVTAKANWSVSLN